MVPRCRKRSCVVRFGQRVPSLSMKMADKVAETNDLSECNSGTKYIHPIAPTNGVFSELKMCSQNAELALHGVNFKKS
ncbi:hypothetical protein T4D_11668 [Trichinella pseudospiralis]|uniref:Uncharacterized protein n=1 Tax=Trichinella pseudospiralis TaxID=6337 RepID=A0A0V1G0L4_TRIPS|nr:hypothetical protein T4D_11668 [Trichinella pseudospiralis]